MLNIVQQAGQKTVKRAERTCLPRKKQCNHAIIMCATLRRVPAKEKDATATRCPLLNGATKDREKGEKVNNAARKVPRCLPGACVCAGVE